MLPPHSLSKLGTRSGIPKDLCLRQDESPRLILDTHSNSATTFPPRNISAHDLYQTTSTSQLDLLEALALEPDDSDGITLHQGFLTMRNPKSDDISNDIQLLACETNYAFKVSEPALTNATAISQEWSSNQDSSNPIAKNMSPRTKLREQHRAAVAPSFSLTKPERKLTQKYEDRCIKDVEYTDSFLLKPPAPSNSSQILAEVRKRMSAIASRELLRRIIVDRAIGSDCIHQLRVESMDENDPKPSSDTSRSSGSRSAGSTPLEPFYLDDLPLRIKHTAGLLPERPWRQHLKIRRSIVSTLAPQTTVRSFRSSFNVEARNGRATDASDHEVVLKSTPYSLTSFSFRHGDIRVKRHSRPISESARNSSARPSLTTTTDGPDRRVTGAEDEEGPADEGLDLPAFQMAISGATSYHWMNECEDCLIDGPHPRLEDLEIKLDELLKWWSEIGLDEGPLVQSDLTAGKERREVLSRRRRRRQVNLEARAENSLSVVGTPEMGQGLNINADADGEDLISPSPYEDMEKEGEGSNGGTDEKEEYNHGGEASLPPSPMQSIGPSALARLETFVPMGFNVDHDLRDFLKWRSECVDSTVEGDI
jgi:hypothetical protein